MIRTIGPYAIVRRLGFGGMAEVHLAMAHGAAGFEKPVAIKTLLPERAGEAALERALIREASIGASLAHRNLVSVLGLGSADGAYYMVMEYVDGGDLAQLGVLPVALARYACGEIARGLVSLHAATDARGLALGLVHRDVGPANVLVSRTGDIKLADFGVAKATALADLTAAGTRKGKWAYMAPEQLAGEPIAQTADQFGLGVTLVELVTGARPFAGDTPLAIHDAIARTPPALGDMPDDLAAIARRALAVDPAARFPSMRALADALAPTPAAEALAAHVQARVG